VLWFSAERERPYRRVNQNIQGGHSLPLAPRLLVIVVLVVVDFAEQIQNGQLLPPRTYSSRAAFTASFFVR
jgi:hypothetical protein